MVGEVANLTQLMRSGTDPMWVILRKVLADRQIPADEAVLAESIPLGDDAELGVLVTRDREVFEVSFEPSSGNSSWQRVTTWWADTPYRNAIAEAMQLVEQV